MSLKLSSLRTPALLICAMVYLIAFGIAILTVYLLNPSDYIIAAAIADIAATIVVFTFSMVFNNSSLYDPYWSIAPIPIAFYWAFNSISNNVDIIRQIVVLLLLTIWAIRLTYNFTRRWKGLGHEDWRYTDIRNNTGKLYWPVSFLGIHIFPTIIVFLGCLSLFPAISSGVNSLGILDILAIIITGTAIWIETKADEELKAFIASKLNKGKIINTGLWKFSRHPNYFGEVLFWWGLYIFAVAANPAYWWVIIGPMAITLLFVFISVPMMDRHMLKNRRNYIENMHKISALVPWFPKG